MKEKLLLYFPIAIVTLGFVIFRAGLRHDNNAFIIIGVSIMILAGAYFLVKRVIQNKSIAKTENNYQEALINFKATARKVSVNLDNVEIKSNNWTEEQEIKNPKYNFVAQIAEVDITETINVDRNLNRMIITIPVDDTVINYVVNIEMEITSLRMHLALKKETYLYILGEETYLDLEFLP